MTAVLLAAVAMGQAGCAKSAPAVDPPPDAPEVTVDRPVVREVTDYFEFPGQTAAVGEVEIRAQVTGYLLKVNFKDGQEVHEGDLLFEIDPEPFKAVLARAEGDLARLQALLDKAKLDLARGDRLRPSGAISEDEYEQHKAQLAVNEASIQSAKAAVYAAELNLKFTSILSPIDGRVSRTRITEGNLVQTGTGESTVLTTVVTTDPIYVYFNIDEPAMLKYEQIAWGSGRAMQASRIKELNIPVEIGLVSDQGFPHAGILDFVDNKVTAGTGTIRARGVFDNSKHYLTPGLYVRVRIPFGKPHQALLVKSSAIGTDQKLKYLLVVNKENKVERREVKLGSRQNDLRVIESGIQPDDRVIVNGLQRVPRPGVTVNPQLAAKPAAAAPAPAYAEQSDRAGAGRATAN
jgi:RND family efflux transporter MFP subunit